jgi:hypothetical protein
MDDLAVTIIGKVNGVIDSYEVPNSPHENFQVSLHELFATVKKHGGYTSLYDAARV